MTNKAKIKVIKKKDLNVVKKTDIKEKNTKQETARKMVSNVSSWVNDFQKRKRVETKQALDSLFPKPPQTDGV